MTRSLSDLLARGTSAMTASRKTSIEPLVGLAVKRRFTKHFSVVPTKEIGLPATHAAVVQGRTLFPSTVKAADESPRILVSGANQRKIGDRVTKGRWSGMPIFCITLEERATCPTTCHHWRSCYGNGMPLARRHKHGEEFEQKLEQELSAKQQSHPHGFVVRVHILGDFYSPLYAVLWRRWMRLFPAIRLFGYTAHGRDTGIGQIIESLSTRYPARASIRFSSQTLDERPGWATTIWHRPTTPTVPQGIICPAQTDRTAACGSCGLCWSTGKTIVFIAHGQKFNQTPAVAA